MGVGPVIFESNGRRTEHFVPGVFSRSGSISNPSGVNAGNCVILGKSSGGKPFELMGFSSLAEAKEVLVGDELLNAVGYAFNGSNIYTPQKIYAMRVNDGKQSSITLNSSEQPMLEISSKDYGYHTNQLKIWLSSQSKPIDPTAKNLKIAFRNEEYEYENIVRPSININYIGEGSTSTVTVTKDGITLTSDKEKENIFKFEDFTTIEELVNRINDTKVYVATSIDTRVNAPSNQLDTVTKLSIKESPQKLYSNLYALIETLKKNIYIGGVTLKSESSRVLPDDMDSWGYFTGGTVGQYTTNEWTKALEMLKSEDIQSIATPSTDEQVQGLIAAHCVEMSSTTNKKERMCFLGGPIGEDDNTAIKKATGFNNQLVSYVTDNAITRNPFTGEVETITGALLSVMLAGMESAMSVNEPLTNKTLNVLGFTTKRTQTNLQKLIQSGICVCNQSPDNPNEYIVIRNLTTFQGDNLLFNERSMVREDQYMNRELRKSLQSAIGRPLDLNTNDIIQTLSDLADKWLLNGYVIPNEDGRPVWNIKVRVVGDTKYLNFDRYLTPPTNFILIDVNNHLYKQSVAMEV